MDLLLMPTYAAICWTIFKIFRIPVNQSTLATAVLGGIFLISALLLLMSYNNSYSSDGRIYFTLAPVIPVVGGQVVVRAPTEDYVTQVFLRPGMMANSLPLRPVMVFSDSQDRMLAAAVIQNSLQRVRVGDDAEVSFKAVPGKIFNAWVQEVVDVMAQGQLQPGGALIDPQSPERIAPGQTLAPLRHSPQSATADECLDELRVPGTLKQKLAPVPAMPVECQDANAPTVKA